MSGIALARTQPASAARDAQVTGNAGVPARATWLPLLGWAFTVFNTARMLAYLPTIWAVVNSGNSGQHSLWTWCTWLGANATMAAWTYEHNGRRLDKLVLVNLGNTSMCTVVLAAVLVYRF